MQRKVEPKLKFEVGEKVIVTAHGSLWQNQRVIWPNKEDFTVTTITKVNEDGTVEVEGGHVYRQSYETEFGELYIHDYFRIKRAPKDFCSTKFNSKEYRRIYRDEYSVKDTSDFMGVTYLFKYSKEFDDKIQEYQREHEIRVAKELARKKEYQEKEARTKSHLDAFNDFMKPLEDELYAKKCRAWKAFVCAHCQHNLGGKCSTWKDENHSYQDIETMEVSSCTAFEGR